MNQLLDILPFTLNTTMIDYVLIDHFKSTEQNAIVNWTNFVY